MLEVQQYLRTNSLEKLQSEFGINTTIHPTDGRIIFNYDIIESKPKDHPIVRECRALTLNFGDWKLLARSFSRFFNWGEVPELNNQFVWEKSRAEHKEDGSLIVVYWHNNQWVYQTRASFGDGQINTFPITWNKLIKEVIGDRFDIMDKNLTYVFELVSPFNKIVASYDKSKVFLLTIFEGYQELERIAVDYEADCCGFDLPKYQQFNSIEQAKEYIDKIASSDPTFEGLVCVDRNNLRIKIKSIKYIELHSFKNNGKIAMDDIVSIILRGDMDEALTYFEELRKEFEKIRLKIVDAEKEILDYWVNAKHNGNQKDFALSVKDSKWSGFLFLARKENKNPIDLFRSNPSLVSKKIGV